MKPSFFIFFGFLLVLQKVPASLWIQIMRTLSIANGVPGLNHIFSMAWQRIARGRTFCFQPKTTGRVFGASI
jgi:hypothetical protein